MTSYREKQLPSIGFINRLCMAGVLLLFLSAVLSLGEFLTGAM
ncbi:hypothetical protein [Halodesulfovibrio spirochaetisodalis]|nr:hypothetical protein [Halodesulfovibrio spirochaetisodalis]